MPQEPLHMLYLLVLLSQVLLISVFLPRQVLGQIRFVIDTYPPDRYPKLYPVSMERVERTHLLFRVFNGLAVLVGLGLVAGGFLRPANEVFRGMNDLVFMGYAILQFAPIVVLSMNPAFIYFNPTRNLDATPKRRAELTRRRVFDFVSPALLAAAVAVYLAFVALIAYVDRFDYPWFGGWGNVAGMTVMNLFFVGLILRSLYGKRRDPYQSYEDRARQLRAEARLMMLVSIAATAFLALNISLRMFDLQGWIAISQSAYLQALALFPFRQMRVDGVDFEVYREDPVTT